MFLANTANKYVIKTTNSQLKNSISSHLAHLLNTKQGTLAHMPDFGLPDLTEVYKRIPSSIAQFKQAIIKTIEKYEPRLKQVQIIDTYIHDNEYSVLKFYIAGQLATGENISFNSNFLNEGRAVIEFL